MSNPYIEYYRKQEGSGIPWFRGLRNQKGYGFLSSFLTKSIIRIFKSIISKSPNVIVKETASVLSKPGLKEKSQIADDIARLGGEASGSFLRSFQKGGKRKYKRGRVIRRKSLPRKSPGRRVTRATKYKRVIRKKKSTKGRGSSKRKSIKRNIVSRKSQKSKIADLDFLV